MAAARKGRRATLAGDLLQIPPSFGGDCDDVVEPRSSSVSPPSTSRGASPTSRRQQRTTRRAVETGQLWALSAAASDRKSQFGNPREDAISSTVGGREGHVIRAFVLSTKGVINVGNTVRGEKVSFDDDNVDDVLEVSGGGHAAAQRPTSLRHAVTYHQRSSPSHSPRRSPQRTSSGDVYDDQSSRRWTPPPESMTEYKVLVVGDHGVGKTELIRQFTSFYAVDALPTGQPPPLIPLSRIVAEFRTARPKLHFLLICC